MAILKCITPEFCNTSIVPTPSTSKLSGKHIATQEFWRSVSAAGNIPTVPSTNVLSWYGRVAGDPDPIPLYGAWLDTTNNRLRTSFNGVVVTQMSL